jgi:DNA repair protein RAD50
MSRIKKLKIRNIRGFGDDWQTIRFFEPLTVISGVNGSGKTSIIEILRFATTGVCHQVHA